MGFSLVGFTTWFIRYAEDVITVCSRSLDGAKRALSPEHRHESYIYGSRLLQSFDRVGPV